MRQQPTSRPKERARETVQTLRKHDRLLKRADFLRVQRRGRKFETRSLLVLVFLRRDKRTKMGIAVSRKFGKGVMRNRVKRLIRELFRRNRTLFPSASDLVIVPKRVRHEVTYHGLVAELEELSRSRWS